MAHLATLFRQRPAWLRQRPSRTTMIVIGVGWVVKLALTAAVITLLR